MQHDFVTFPFRKVEITYLIQKLLFGSLVDLPSSALPHYNPYTISIFFALQVEVLFA
jgi:hypothetical protein